MSGGTNAGAFVFQVLIALTASAIGALVKMVIAKLKSKQSKSIEATKGKPQGKKQRFSLWSVIIAGAIAAVGFFISFANFTLIAKSYRYPDQVPTFMGVAPLIVLSNSMAPTFENNDLIFIKKASAEELNVYDIIAFRTIDGYNTVTHRIIEIGEEDGTRLFFTKGDANTAADPEAVYADQLVGKYCRHIGSAGASIIFLSSPIGNIFLMLFNASTLSILFVSILIYFSKRKQKRNEQIAC